MSHSHANRAEEIQNSIREVFNKYWDPIGVADDPEIQDEYDSYIAPVYRVLVGSRLDKEIISYLSHVETNLMGLKASTSAQLQKVADLLLSLDVKLKAG